MKILIADDSSEFRERIVERLLVHNDRKQIVEAENVRQTMESVLRDQPHLVVLDLHFPDGNGLEVLTWIKQNRPSIVVVVFSSDDDEESSKECLARGAERFFSKSEYPDLLRYIE
jgi:two-component system KDP operon response regulator KdpE